MTRPAVIIGTSAVVAFAAAVFLWSRTGGDGAVAPVGDESPAVDDAGRSAGSGGARPSLLPSPDAPGSARLSGRVIHRRTGDALSGIELRFVGPIEVAEESAADGAYGVVLAPGPYRISVVEPGLGPAGSTSLRVASGALLEGVDVLVDDVSRVRGRVVSGDGEPLAGASLSCRQAAGAAADGLCSAISSEKGDFGMLVPSGAVELVARGPRGAGSGTVALSWVLPGAELTGVEIVVDAGGTVSGRVLSPTGAPVVGARVRLWPAPPLAAVTGERQPLVGDALVADSDKRGQFTAPGVWPGAVHVVAQHPDYAPAAAARVDLAPGGEVTGLSFVLRKPLSVTGRVVDEAGAALVGATVRARRTATGERVAESAAGEGGRFELRGLDRGPFDLFAIADGRAPGRRGALAVPADDVVLEVPRFAAVSGTVSSAGQPVTDFRVQLRGHVPIGGGPRAADQGPVRVLDAGGRFRFDDLEPGGYQLSVSAPGLGPALVPVTAPAGATGGVNVELKTGSVLVGRVSDAASGRAISGALVTASTGFAGDGAYTDESGDYRLRDIAAGRRSVSAVHPAYVGKIESAVVFGVGDRRRLDLRLDPRRPGAGQVIEFAGIGAAISMTDGVLTVGGVLEHSPAAVAGLLTGDRIVRIDGVETAGRTLADNVEDIRGLVGTSVLLDVARGDERFERDVVRGTVRFRPDEP